MLPEGFYFAKWDGRSVLCAAGAEDIAITIARLIVESGRAYFTSFYGSEQQATEFVARCLPRPTSVFSASNLTVLHTETKVAGILVAFPGAELERRQKADLLFVLQSLSATARAEMTDRLRGRVFVSAKAEAGDFYLRALTVAADFRGRKLSGALLQRAFALASQAGASVCKLDVYESNAGAVHVYRSAGFIPATTAEDAATKDRICTMVRAVGNPVT